MLSRHAADRACLAELECRILDLERSLSVLRLERTVVQERVDSYTYPVLTLPNEITSEVFIHFLPIYPLPPPLIGDLSPTLLTHICHQWREIALATPALWRAISLFGNYLPRNRISNMLNRSGWCPLSIQMDDLNEVPPGSDILAVILPYHARWEYLKLVLTGHHLPTIGGVPLLHHLDLELQHHVSEDFVIREAPLLRTAVLHSSAAENIVLPWTQLTSLTLREIDVRDSETYLRRAPNLVHCQLDLLTYWEREHPPPPEIRLPSLKSLFWNIQDIEWSAPVPEHLGVFRVPALRSLQFTEMLLHPDPIDFLTSFISKSDCDLEEVRITGDRVIHEDSYQEAFPSIQFVFVDN
ncbi:hypothetical protein K438DRAFT_1862353 [Mycena galopus ATCC 62051]|nr:hypothetical protein K438DRAFT_1862353 [Mycena galopus ATCC 62051]